MVMVGPNSLVEWAFSCFLSQDLCYALSDDAFLSYFHYILVCGLQNSNLAIQVEIC
jgi:hypothetical protein